MSASIGAERRARLVGVLAAIAAALTLVVITVSALIRLAHAGLGCEPWPQCYGAPLTATWLGMVRATHRVFASAVALVVLTAFFLAASGGRAAARLTAIAGGALATVVLLTWVGIITPGAQLPAVAIANVLGGMVLFASLWWLLLATRIAPAPHPQPVAALTLAAIPLVFAQIALGVLAHATFGSASCASLAGCAEAASLAQFSAHAFDPFRPVTAEGARSLPQAGAAVVQMAHRLLALGLTAWLLAVAWRAQRVSTARKSAAALVALIALQTGSGALLVALRLPLAAAVAHNAMAPLLLAALVQLVYRLRAPPLQ